MSLKIRYSRALLTDVLKMRFGDRFVFSIETMLASESVRFISSLSRKPDVSMFWSIDGFRECMNWIRGVFKTVYGKIGSCIFVIGKVSRFFDET